MEMELEFARLVKRVETLEQAAVPEDSALEKRVRILEAKTAIVEPVIDEKTGAVVYDCTKLGEGNVFVAAVKAAQHVAQSEATMAAGKVTVLTVLRNTWHSMLRGVGEGQAIAEKKIEKDDKQTVSAEPSKA